MCSRTQENDKKQSGSNVLGHPVITTARDKDKQSPLTCYGVRNLIMIMCSVVFSNLDIEVLRYTKYLEKEPMIG